MTFPLSRRSLLGAASAGSALALGGAPALNAVDGAAPDRDGVAGQRQADTDARAHHARAENRDALARHEDCRSSGLIRCAKAAK